MEMPLFLREEKLKVAHSFHTVEFANKCPGNLLTFFVADLSWLRGFSGKMETGKLLNLVARVVSTARSLLGFCFCDRQTESLIDSLRRDWGLYRYVSRRNHDRVRLVEY
jgi:hypothetical protein